MRQFPGRRFLSCLPRTPGSVSSDRSRTGRAVGSDKPLDVTCTTTVTANDLRAWQADIEVAWPATDGHEAGRWARRILFDASGAVQSESDVAPGTGEPLAFPGDPSTTDLPTDVATFAPGDLVRSVGAGATRRSTTSIRPGCRRSRTCQRGARHAHGHRVGTRGSTTAATSMWRTTAARSGGSAPRQRVSRCSRRRSRGCPPSLDATDLVYLSLLERRLCLTGEVALGPVQAGRVELDPSWGLVESDPAWLAAASPNGRSSATESTASTQGSPVALAPSVESLPTEGWVLVRGHFDDPAASTCRVVYPADWGTPTPPPDVQTRRCQERFVVTSVEPTEGP